MNPVATYCRKFADSGLEPHAFAVRMLAQDRQLCVNVLDHIGSFPSSEPELRALQRAFR